MDTFIITGGKALGGEVAIGGAKNVALKSLVASILTDEEVVIRNVPHIRDVELMVEVLKTLGVRTNLTNNTVTAQNNGVTSTTVPLELGAHLRTSSMVLGPLLARYKTAKIPNPGGCRIGARPIDRHIEGLRAMGANIVYHSEDGFFHASTEKLTGTRYRFEKNTHTGTETLLLAAVLADGETVLENAAEEVEIDDLINLLNQMGAKIKRTKPREIVVDGVKKLNGTDYTIMPDRNEEITFAIAAAVTGGAITVKNSRQQNLAAFLEYFNKSGAKAQRVDENTTQYQGAHGYGATDVATAPYPGFMTDWQAPWAVLMTQAVGVSTIHETVFESRFSYVSELVKMGADIEFYDPDVKKPEEFYNFNWKDRVSGYHQGIRIKGPTKLHNAILEIDDLRAGATLVLAALAASGTSYVHRVEQIDRGYEKIEERLRMLGASIERVKEE
ncbi:UDP-N-acetylglucosamine 1-carboxyvinyltransferase [Candidatus Gottesmanbacteria bacterium]|nr:UDP-N-acetylglucosamine 1-carboxyvinyltransferase [Candidatus Gottesmanbacteria bacterium]